MPLSDERLAEMHWCEDCQEDHAFDLAERTRLRAEVERLTADLGDERHMSAAYRTSRDEHKRHRLAAEAEVERLRARVAAVKALAETWGNASQSHAIYKRPFGAAIRAALASEEVDHAAE